jgi:hypothetical protein
MTEAEKARPTVPQPRATTRPRSAAAERAELVELYKVAVEEYRFQVQLNWDRAKYLLGFNIAVIGAGTGLVKVGSNPARGLVAGLFIVGLIAAAFSIFAIYLQHGYYRSARDTMTALARRIGLGDSAVATTPGARSMRTTAVSQIGKIQNILYSLLLVAASIDAYGVYYAFGK